MKELQYTEAELLQLNRSERGIGIRTKTKEVSDNDAERDFFKGIKGKKSRELALSNIIQQNI